MAGTESGRLGDERHVLSYQVAELLVGMHGLQSAVELDGRLDIAVAENAPNRLVIAGMMFEIDGRGGMAELVNCDPHPRGLFNSLGDLRAEGLGVLASAGLAREQPELIRSAQQGRTELIDIFVDEGGQLGIEWILEVLKVSSRHSAGTPAGRGPQARPA